MAGTGGAALTSLTSASLSVWYAVRASPSLSEKVRMSLAAICTGGGGRGRGKCRGGRRRVTEGETPSSGYCDQEYVLVCAPASPRSRCSASAQRPAAPQEGPAAAPRPPRLPMLPRQPGQRRGLRRRRRPGRRLRRQGPKRRRKRGWRRRRPAGRRRACARTARGTACPGSTDGPEVSEKGEGRARARQGCEIAKGKRAMRCIA